MNNIDNLIADFNKKINMVDGNQLNANQANVNQINANQVNIDMLKLHVDTIPMFDGDENNLAKFLNSCDFVVNTYANVNDPAIQSYILQVIKSRFVDRANLLVGSRNELNTWNSIRESLQQCFGDRRSLECLEQDLLTAHPQRNEQPIDFARRLQILRSHLIGRINNFTDAEIPLHTKESYRRQYNQMALRTLLRNLSGNLQTIIRLKNPINIEQAITYIIEEENFAYSQNNLKQIETPQYRLNSNRFNDRQNFNNNHQNSNNNRRHFSNNQYRSFPQIFQNTRNQPDNAYQRNFAPIQLPVTYQNNSFPSQPIPVQPRTINRYYPTNRQVFGPPKNGFAPTGQIPPNSPVPMSTTTRNTFRPRQNFQNYQQPMSTTTQNTFRPRQNYQQNFATQQLFQTNNIDFENPFEETPIDQIEYEFESYLPNHQMNSNSENNQIPINSDPSNFEYQHAENFRKTARVKQGT